MYIKKLLSIFLFYSLLIFLIAFNCYASSQRLINFQGYLTNQEGTVYGDGTYTIVFALYNTPAGGSPIWTERHETVSVTSGLVNVLLGSMTSFEEPDAGAERVDFSVTRYLSITIDADNNPATLDPEMLPRQQIVPAIHAYESDYAKEADLAKDAETVMGKTLGTVNGIATLDQSGKIPESQLPPFDFAASNHVHTFDEIQGAITDAQVPNTITINKATDADTVDGKHASAFASAGHGHSRSIVVWGGDITDSRWTGNLVCSTMGYGSCIGVFGKAWWVWNGTGPDQRNCGGPANNTWVKCNVGF